MSNLFDKLNLRPQERRLVVIVGIVVFVVLNFWLVFPMFGDYGLYQQRLLKANVTLKNYQAEIARRGGYEKEISTLEGQGSRVPTPEAALQLSTEVNSHAALSGVTVTSLNQLPRQTSGKTNAFFEEVTVVINFNTGEKELVDFLYRLADKDLLIRARSMEIGTDTSKMRLQGQLTLVKSFQKPVASKAAPTTAAAKPAPAPTPAPAATAKPTPAAASGTSVPAKPTSGSVSTSAPPAKFSGTNKPGQGRGMTMPTRSTTNTVPPAIKPPSTKVTPAPAPGGPPISTPIPGFGPDSNRVRRPIPPPKR